MTHLATPSFYLLIKQFFFKAGGKKKDLKHFTFLFVWRGKFFLWKIFSLTEGFSFEFKFFFLLMAFQFLFKHLLLQLLHPENFIHDQMGIKSPPSKKITPTPLKLSLSGSTLKHTKNNVQNEDSLILLLLWLVCYNDFKVFSEVIQFLW